MRTAPTYNVNPQPSVACFGEALWDVLPGGLFPGGAPLNVAYHLRRQGMPVRLLSAVGRDFLGDELLRRLTAWGVTTTTVARLPRRPTGTVCAEINANGAASYTIGQAVAWDRIPVPAGLARSTPPSAIVFGTLALREKPNRATFDTLLNAWPAALRVLDLNLRPPFATPETVHFAVRRAHLLKLNEDELGTITRRRLRGPGDIERAARVLGDTHAIERICVTAGAAGAGLLWDGEWLWEPARRVKVQDTVGAGDAFLASLLSASLRNIAPRKALAAACRMGEFVASKPGPTPEY